MSIAKKLNAEEILSLPLGAVAWREERLSYDNPEEDVYGIPYCFLYPVMVADENDFCLIGAREGCEPEYWKADATQTMLLWDRKPESEQLKGLYHWDLDEIPERTLLEMSDTNQPRLPALRKRILWEYGSIAALASRIGMNAKTLGGKLNGRTDFRYSEIISISKALGFGEAQIKRYFFTD